MKPYNLYTDEQLIQLLSGGDRKAFEYIFKKYWPLLFDAAYKRVNSKEVAEEIIQELFTYLWCKRGNIQLTQSFSTYIYVALKYRIFNHIRTELNKKKYAQWVTESQPRFINAVEENILFNELNSNIEREINNLPERCKQVFQLSRKENLTFKEIALKLDISINTVEKHIGKALKILRTNLKDHIATYPCLFFLFF